MAVPQRLFAFQSSSPSEQLASLTCDRKERCTSNLAADIGISNLASARALAIQQGYVFAGVLPNAPDIKRADLGGTAGSAFRDLCACC